MLMLTADGGGASAPALPLHSYWEASITTAITATITAVTPITVTDTLGRITITAAAGTTAPATTSVAIAIMAIAPAGATLAASTAWRSPPKEGLAGGELTR